MAIVLPQAFAPALVTSTFAWSIGISTLGGNMIWILLGVSSAYMKWNGLR